MLAQLIGIFIELDESTTNKDSLDVVRVMVSTSYPAIINKTIHIKVFDVIFSIKIMEERHGVSACSLNHVWANKFLAPTSSEGSASEFGSWVDVPETVFTGDIGGQRRLQDVVRVLNSNVQKSFVSLDGTNGRNRLEQTTGSEGAKKQVLAPMAVVLEVGWQKLRKNKDKFVTVGKSSPDVVELSIRVDMPKTNLGLVVKGDLAQWLKGIVKATRVRKVKGGHLS